jgi:mRNA-degrading endonuclease RelE of RelBE toxin-antitoxin system
MKPSSVILAEWLRNDQKKLSKEHRKILRSLIAQLRKEERSNRPSFSYKNNPKKINQPVLPWAVSFLALYVK